MDSGHGHRFMCPGRTAVLELISAGRYVPQGTPFNTALISPTLRCSQMTPFGENYTMWRVTKWNDHTYRLPQEVPEGKQCSNFPLKIGL